MLAVAAPIPVVRVLLIAVVGLLAVETPVMEVLNTGAINVVTGAVREVKALVTGTINVVTGVVSGDKKLVRGVKIGEPTVEMAPTPTTRRLVVLSMPDATVPVPAGPFTILPTELTVIPSPLVSSTLGAPNCVVPNCVMFVPNLSVRSAMG